MQKSERNTRVRQRSHVKNKYVAKYSKQQDNILLKGEIQKQIKGFIHTILERPERWVKTSHKKVKQKNRLKTTKAGKSLRKMTPKF